MRKVSSWILIASCALPVGCASSAAPAKSPASEDVQAKPALEGVSLVLDVRTPEEYAQGHLERAAHIPVTELEARIGEIEAALGGDKSKKILTYCGSGARAARAQALLEQHGYTNVVNGGGYDDLK